MKHEVINSKLNAFNNVSKSYDFKKSRDEFNSKPLYKNRVNYDYDRRSYR